MTQLFDSVEAAVADIAAGKLVIVTDDENRENEGDLIMAASKATPETVNMMIRYGSGIVCVPMLDAQLRRLGLGSMVAQNREVQRTDFTVTVDATAGISTGISAADRTRTIKLLADPETSMEDLVQPGHVFPLRARPGGVLHRAGHTEAAIDLATLAGLPQAGVLCELVNDDGTVQRMPQLQEFRQKFGLKMISIAQLIEYRTTREKHVHLIGQHEIATPFGPFEAYVFRSDFDERNHVALVKGTISGDTTLVRVHRENVLGDLLPTDSESDRIGVDKALQKIAEADSGVLLVLTRDPSGEAWLKTLRGEQPGATSQPMFREYGLGAQILNALGLRKIRLLSSSDYKPVGLEGHGLEIVGQVSLRD
ncbi:MAG: 3,4-dihydroxy-2-butanone-4-phosphate synthase [Opitutaceae bacterium]|nr:3,4-dihydroxy-2-butanone-4-phosphate synthase [Opitutaceae bacterium]